MNVTKKLGRMKQWAGERMGGEVKTNTSDEFKALEMEMNLRYEGMERLNKSMNAYVKSLSKRSDADEKEKVVPIAYLGSTMSSHGDDFEPDSEFGQCLMTLGRANERIARMQENYVASATSSWLESLERSLTQMKEYQAARKKLESRRLAYDTSQAKMQKSKKEDYRMEEELRAQKYKYEESTEDVYRRMLDIKEAEVDSVADLSTFLDAELTYYDRAREVLIQLKRDWPAVSTAPTAPRRNKSRSNTLSSLRTDEDSDSLDDYRPPIRSRQASAQGSPANTPRRELPGFDFSNAGARPAITRTMTFEGPRSLQTDAPPQPQRRLSRLPSETLVLNGRSALRPVRRDAGSDVFGDPNNDIENQDDLEGISPATSQASYQSRSWGAQDAVMPNGSRKIPPPPPPSRSKKPPPPPPLKRSALSTSEVPIA